MSFEIKNLWSTPVLKTNLSNFEDERLYILDKITQLRATGAKNVALEEKNTTVGGFQTVFDLSADEGCQRVGPELLNYYSSKYWKELASNNPAVPQEVNLEFLSWVMQYDKGSYQNQHMHKSSLLSGLWFLEVDEQEPGAGELHLQNPNIPSFTLGFYTEVMHLQPKTNDVYIFPSWLAHNVTPTTAARTVMTWDVVAAPSQ
jgi:hypothetical protein